MKNIRILLIPIILYTTISFAENKIEKNIISRNELEYKNTGKIEDYFRFYTGADITDYGQPGLPRYISLLGLSNQHTLITLDGREINSFTDGYVNLNHIPISLIKSIELKKGINSVSDSPNTLGGSINILTSDPDNDIPFTRLYSLWGTSGLENYGINFKNQNGSLRYSIFADKIFSHGFGIYRQFNIYNSVKFYSKIDWYYDTKTWFTLTAGKYDDNTGMFTAAGVGEDKSKDKHLQLKYETHQANTALKIRFYGNNYWFEQNISDALFTFKNSTQGNEEIIEQNIGKYHLIRVGKEHKSNKFNGNITQNEITDLVNKEESFYYEDEISINNLMLSIGQRHDNNSLFLEEKSPRFKVNYQAGPETALFLSAGQGVSFPKINDLYVQGTYYKGNPNLITEKGWVYTLGLEKTFTDLVSINLSGHFADINNFILWDYDSTLSQFQVKNVSSVRSKGAETEIKFKISEKTDIQTIYTYSITEDQEIKKSLPYRPENKIKTNLSYKVSKYNGDLLWVIALGHEYQGERYSDRDNSNKLKAFNTFNFNINMILVNAFTLNLAATNLGDNDYSLVDGYDMPKSNYWGGITWDFWN